MSTQDLQTPDELEAQTHSSAPAPLNSAKAEGTPTVHAETEAEVQRAFRQAKIPWSTRWLLGNTRGYGASIKIEEKEADRLLKMEVEEVLELLRHEKQSRSRQKLHSIKVGLVVLVFSLALAKYAHIDFFLHYVLGAFFSVCIGTAVVSQTARAAALAIARFDDVRAVGPLAEALEFKDKYVLSIASRALIRLLPHMQASDASLLSPAQRACLDRVMKGGNPELILAVLKAWEQVGDADAIDNVQDLAYGRMEGGRYPKVVAAARECLPFLRQSAERHQVGAQLLRPVDNSVTSPRDLLRPASSDASTTPPNELLRSTDSL